MIFNHAPGESVTQRDIARVLGVSNATVSLALRDSGSLTRERCEEVQVAAKRMGYRPNANAATRSSKQLDACRKGADEAARKLGYVLEEIRIDQPSKRTVTGSNPVERAIGFSRMGSDSASW